MKIASLVLTMAVLCAFGASMTPQTATTVTAQGVDAVEVLKVSATVEKVDLGSRKVTLLFENGKKKTYKVDKSVQNLDQVKVGDKLKISYTEELVILVGKSNEKPGAAEGGAVGVSPKGAKPGIVMVDTVAVSAKILAVNEAKHTVTLEDPDNKKKTVKLGSKVSNLDQLKVGETVDLLMTESLVVEIVR